MNKPAKAIDLSGKDRYLIQSWVYAHSTPQRTRSFKLSGDRKFVERLTDIAGLHMNPRDEAVVLCVDEMKPDSRTFTIASWMIAPVAGSRV